MFTLINKAKWLLSGNILFAFSQWLTLILFAKLTSSQALGQYAFALSITAPIFMLTNLQLRPLLIADYHGKKKYDFEDFFSLRFYSNFVAFLIVFIWGSVSNPEALIIIMVVASIKFLESISDILYAYYNADNKTKLITKSLTIKAIASLTFVILALLMSKSVGIGVFSIFLTYLLVLFTIDLRILKPSLDWFKFNYEKIKELALYALPLGIAVMLVSLQTNMPRYFIEKYQSIEDVGIFTVFYYFIVIGGIFINSVCQYLSPYYSSFWHQGDVKNFWLYVKYSWLISFIFSFLSFIFVCFFGEYIISLIYGENFIKHLYVLKLLMFSSLFVYLSVVNGYILTSLNVLKIQVPMFVFLILISIMFSYCLIPNYGLRGAAWVCCISALAQFSISLLVLIYKIRGSHVKA
jgi:O-antigen/teichoic acid export membrane protein